MKYKKTTLPNGLRIITVPTKGNPSVTVMILVETGSNYETRSQNGLSHFLEHMMFKGTTRRPTAMHISRELDGLGAESNAFTANEMTGYWAKAERKHFEHLLDILSDMYLNPTLPPAELEKERGVILQEIAMYEDLPQRKVWDVFGELMYGDTPAGRSIAGPAQNIKKFKRDDFEDYRRAHYVAKKTVIVVSGDISEKQAIKGIKELFATIPDHKRLGKEPVKERQVGPKIAIYSKKKTDQTHLVMGFRTFDAKDKRGAALAVLSGVLGKGMSSRLFQKLREDMGVCYYVRTSESQFTDHGSFAISTGIDPNRVTEVIDALIDECSHLKTELVSEAELKKAKDYIIGHLYMGLETTESLAEFYADQEITRGKIENPSDIDREIRRVTPEDVRDLAREIFKKERLNVAIVGNVKNQARLRKHLVI